MPESIPLFEKGDSITGSATAAVPGARFVRIAAARGADSLLKVGLVTANTQAVFGISAHDAATGELVGIHHQPAIITEVTAGAALAAGALVMSDAVGQAIPYVAGAGVLALGTALDDAAAGAKALIDRSAR